jgi:predicted Fe-S protein YdhL (DUF1289 family)
LAAPCCSQFAVTKERIRSVPRERYRAFLDWLRYTELDDHIVGRLWERQWQWLFLRTAVDCPVEYEALCRGWNICFKSQEEFMQWNKIYQRREEIAKELKDLGRREENARFRLWDLEDEIERVELHLEAGKANAVRRGQMARS